MVASTDVKFYVHTNNNAPQLTNNFGCMIDVLVACLVNGFGSQTVSTLNASGTTVTATFGSAHNFMQYQVIKIAGATQTEYNGEFRILTVPNANSITFQLAAARRASGRGRNAPGLQLRHRDGGHRRSGGRRPSPAIAPGGR